MDFDWRQTMLPHELLDKLVHHYFFGFHALRKIRKLKGNLMSQCSNVLFLNVMLENHQSSKNPKEANFIAYILFVSHPMLNLKSRCVSLTR